MANKITWDQANFKWNDNPHIWNEVLEIIEIASQGGDAVTRPGLAQLDKEQKRKLVRCIMYFKDIKVYDEEKEIKQISAYVNDVNIIAEELKKNVQIIY